MRKFAANSNSSPARLRIRPVAAACATLLVATTAAYGQQATLEAVTVTGIRASIESSIAAKRGSDSIVEVVTAEDIGKLPDASIAESLARLPGLTSTRVDGRAQSVVIRGLAPQYGATLLNGREVASSGESRAAEYDQFPSELVNSATVYKTPDAGLVGQGLSGTIDVKSLRPLDLKGRQLVVNVRGDTNSNGSLTHGVSATGNRVSVSYVDQFADNTIGLALGYAHLNSPGQKKESKIWGIDQSGLPGLPAKTSAVMGFDAEVQSSTQVRDGLMAVLQFKPSKDFSSILDLNYSKFSQERNSTRLTSIIPDWGGWSGSVNPTFSNVAVRELQGNKIVSSGTVSGAQVIFNNNWLKRDDDVQTIGWKNELKFADKWTGTADLSMSRANRVEKYAEIYTAPKASGVTSGNLPSHLVTLNFRGLGSPGDSMFSTSQNLANVGNTVVTKGEGWNKLNEQTSDDEIRGLRLSAKRDLNIPVVSGVEFGVNLSNRTKKVRGPQTDLDVANGTAANFYSVPLPASAVVGTADLTGAGFAGSIPAVNVQSLLPLFKVGSAKPWMAAPNDYGVEEKVTTAYTKFNVDTELGNVPVRGNFGVQFVKTDQTASGFAWVNDKSYAISEGSSYNDVLPSLNLAFNLQPDFIARLGVSKTMMRPVMANLRSGADQPRVEIDPKSGLGTWKMNGGGNPALEPWRAKGIDLSFEKYFGKRSYVAGAVFHKQLETTIYNQKTIRDFSAYYATLDPTKPRPASPYAEVSLPANGKGGKISGVELSASLDAGLISKSLDGFGVSASWSNTDSGLQGTDQNGNATNDPIDGLSGIVNTLSVYYEKNGFSGRVGQRYRSAYNEVIRSMIWGNQYLTHPDETVVDLQLGYAFEAGSYKGLSLVLQVNNLLDTPSRTQVSVGGDGKANNFTVLPEYYRTYGRTILFGGTYKF